MLYDCYRETERNLEDEHKTNTFFFLLVCFLEYDPASPNDKQLTAICLFFCE